MPARTLSGGSVQILGGRFPLTVFALAATTLVATIAGAMGLRMGLPFVRGALLQPSLLMSGQLWRLVTWVFFELDALGLIFYLLILLFFGRELYYAWGRRRFLSVFFGLAAGSAIVTCIVGLAWQDVWHDSYLSPWPIAEAFTIAWGVLFPGRQILVYFVLPIGGRSLVYLTIGTVVVFALMGGVSHFIPHFAAMALILAYLGRPGRLWLELRRAWPRGRRRPGHLRPVEGGNGEAKPRWVH